MEKLSSESVDEWFSLSSDSHFRRGSDSSQIVRLEYLSSINAILSVSSENEITLYDANSAEFLREYEKESGADGNLLLCHHPYTGGVIVSDGCSMGYRCHIDGVLMMKTILQTSITSGDKIVTLELPFSQAKNLLQAIEISDYVSPAQGTKEQNPGDMDCIKELVASLSKEIDKCPLGAYSPANKWASLQLSMKYSTLKSACSSLLQIHQDFSKMMKEQLQMDLVAKHNHMLNGLSFLSTMLHQLVLLDHTENTESSDLLDRRKMYSEMSRRKSFSAWPHENYKYASSKAMAEAGFFYQPAAAGDDRAICFACSVCLVCWEPSDEPWSEHERHSPTCPFVRCEPTMNVPMAVTLAYQPALPNPLMRLSDEQLGHSSGMLQFLVVGNHCSLVVGATKSGRFVLWNVCDRKPPLQGMLLVDKTTLHCQVRDQVKCAESALWKSIDSDDLCIKEWIVTSICVLDKLDNPDLIEVMEKKCTQKPPVIAVGAVVEFTSMNEESGTSLFCSVLFFLGTEAVLSSMAQKDATTSAAQDESSQYSDDGDLTSEEAMQIGNQMPELLEYDMPDSIMHIPPDDSNQSKIHVVQNSDVGSDLHLKDTNKENNPPSGDKEGVNIDEPTPAKILQVVLVDVVSQDESGKKLQVISNVLFTNNNNQIVATSHPTLYSSGVSTNCSATTETNQEQPEKLKSAEISQETTSPVEEFGRAYRFAISPSQSAICVEPAIVNDSDEGRVWVSTPASIEICELPEKFSDAVSNDEADTDSTDGDFIETDMDMETEVDREEDESQSVSKNSYVLMLGDDGILRLLDVTEMKTVLEIKPEDGIGDKFVAFTFCADAGQICIATKSGKLTFIKVGRQPAPKTCDESKSADSYSVTKEPKENKQEMAEQDYIANQPLTKSTLNTLYQLTKFEPLKPRFHAKTPPHWAEVPLHNLSPLDMGSRLSLIERFDNVGGKMRRHPDVTLQVKQQRRHLRHPNEHYSYDCNLHTRAWKLHGESNGKEIFEIFLPRPANLSHIDLKFVLNKRIKTTDNIQVTLLKHKELGNRGSNPLGFHASRSNENLAHGKDFGEVASFHAKIQHLLSKDFVDTMLDRDVPNPVLLVVSTASGGYYMMDGSGKTVLVFCKSEAGVLPVSSMVELNSYMRVKVGGSDFRLLANSFRICTRDDLEPSCSTKESEKSETNLCGSSVDAENDENTSLKHEHNYAAEESCDFGRSDVLFGPALLSNWTDSSGLGGVVTIAGKKMMGCGRQKALILLIENVKKVTPASKEPTAIPKEFRSAENLDHLQEISVTIYKPSRVLVKQERLQRMRLLQCRHLHAKLLSSLCRESSAAGWYVAESLPEKIVALEILNWVAALSPATAVSSPQTLKTDVTSKTQTLKPDTVKKPNPYTLAHLMCYFVQSRKYFVDKHVKQGAAVEFEFSLKQFLMQCFLQQGRDVASRAYRLVTNTILSSHARGYHAVAKLEKVNARNYLCVTVIECLKAATKMSITSAYGLNGLHEILSIFMNTELYRVKNLKEASKWKAHLNECFAFVASASELMRDAINPLDKILRANHGLYACPFDSPLTVTDLESAVQKRTVKDPSYVKHDADSTQYSWDEYFSGEEFDLYELANPHELSCAKVVSVFDSIDEYYINARFSIMECQPLHYTCIESSENCVFGYDANSDDESVILKGYPKNKPSVSTEASSPEGLQDSEVCALLDYYMDFGKFANSNTESGQKAILAESYQMDISTSSNDTMETTLEETPESSAQGGSNKEEPEENSHHRYHIPNLSFLTPRQSHISISRLHSGAKRGVVLDFFHFIELTDIIIPSCKEISSLIVEAWPAESKRKPTVNTPGFVTVAVSLDINDHNFHLTNVSPPLIARYLRITVAGRFGSSNPQTVVKLGQYFGRPSFVSNDRSSSADEPIKSSKISSMKSTGDATCSKKNGKKSVFHCADLAMLDKGKYASQQYLKCLRKYIENVNCQYELMCSELKYLLSLKTKLGDHAGKVGGRRQNLSQGRVYRAYRKCVGLQVRKTRVEHAIRYLESVDGVSSVKSGDGPSFSQLELQIELMLSTIVMLQPAILRKVAIHRMHEIEFPRAMAVDMFQNLIGFGNPRVRVQTCNLLVAHCSAYAWWGSFLADLLSAYLIDGAPMPCLTKAHLVSVFLVLGQRTLVIPGKGEDMMRNILKLIEKSLAPRDGNSGVAGGKYGPFAVLLMIASHLTESILWMNEAYVDRVSPCLMRYFGGRGPVRDILGEMASKMQILKKETQKPPKFLPPHLWHQPTSKDGPAQGHANKPTGAHKWFPVKKIPAVQYNSWDFINFRRHKKKNADVTSGFVKTLTWLEAVREKILRSRNELVQLAEREKILKEKLQSDKIDMEEKNLIGVELSKISVKSSEQYRSMLSHRRQLDRKALNAMLANAKPTEMKVQEEVPSLKSFIRVSLVLCQEVTRKILLLLLKDNTTIPSDLIVLMCKMCSQFCYWTNLQCVHFNGRRANKGPAYQPNKGPAYQPVILSPLSLPLLLSQDEITRLLLVASGMSDVATQNNSPQLPVNCRVGPWVEHALNQLLQDMFKFEKAGLMSASTRGAAKWEQDKVDGESDPSVSNFMKWRLHSKSDVAKKPEKSQDDSESKSATPSQDTRLQLADTFIGFCETFIKEIKDLLKPETAPKELSDLMFGTDDDEHFAPKSKSVVLESAEEDMSKMAQNRHHFCSYVYDCRSVHGVDRKYLMAMKRRDLSHIRMMADSIRTPPFAHVKNQGETFPNDGCVLLADNMKTISAVQRSIDQILPCFINSHTAFITFCKLILSLQFTYDELKPEALGLIRWRQDIIEVGTLKEILRVANFNSPLSHNNTQMWSLVLKLLNSVISDRYIEVALNPRMSMEEDVNTVVTLLKADFGMIEFLEMIFSVKLAAYGVSNACVHNSMPVLGPSICDQLETLFQRLDKVCGLAIDSSKLRVGLRDSLLCIVESLAQSSSFSHFADTPTDGQIVLLHAVTDLCLKTKHVFTGGRQSIISLASSISKMAFNYLMWSSSSIKNRDPTILPACALYQETERYSSLMRNSPRDYVMVKLLKLISILSEFSICDDNASKDQEMMEHSEELESEHDSEQSTELENDPSEPKTWSHVIFEDSDTVQTLLSALAISIGSPPAHDVRLLTARELDDFATTVIDGVFLWLASLFSFTGDQSMKVDALMRYFRGPADSFGLQMPAHSTCAISYPLSLFAERVVKKPGDLLNGFVNGGGLDLIVMYLISSSKQGSNPTQSAACQMMQYLSAASDRAAAFAPNHNPLRQHDAHWPTLKGSKSLIKVKNTGQNFHIAQQMAEGVHISTAGKYRVPSSREGNDFDYAQIASMECSDPAASPPDGLLKSKSLHRRARTPVWSYHYLDNVDWVTLTINFPTAFLLRRVQIVPTSLGYGVSPSAIILEVNQSGSTHKLDYHPISSPILSSANGDTVLVPASEHIVCSLRLVLKKPADSSCIGLSRIAVLGAPDFTNYQPSSLLAQQIVPDRPQNHVPGSDDSSAIWIMFLHHFVSMDDEFVTKEIVKTASASDEFIPTLCKLLKSEAHANIVTQVESILLRIASVVDSSKLIDCMLHGGGIQRYEVMCNESTTESMKALTETIYQLSRRNDDQLPLRLTKMMDWIAECSHAAISRFNFTSVNVDLVHAISCGLWQCAHLESVKDLASVQLTEAVYNWSQASKANLNIHSHVNSIPRLKNALDWLLCSLCHVNLACYYALLQFMGFTNANSTIPCLTSNQIETLAFASQTEGAINVLLEQGIIHLFANGLQHYCCTLLESGEDFNLPGRSMEVTCNNLIPVVEFFSTLASICAVQQWLGSEEGSKCWKVLLKTVDHIMYSFTQKENLDTVLCHFPVSLLLDLQGSTITLLKQICKCNVRNRGVVSRAICNVISANAKRLSSNTFTGFARSLLLRVILEVEEVTIHVEAKEGAALCSSLTRLNRNLTMNHPMYGFGRSNYVETAGVDSLVADVRSAITERDVRKKIYKKKTKILNPIVHPNVTPFKVPPVPGAATSVPMSSYAGMLEPNWKKMMPKLTDGLEGWLMSAHMSGKQAQDKRKSQMMKMYGGLVTERVECVSDTISIVCQDLHIVKPTLATSLLEIAAGYQFEKVPLFLNRVKLEAVLSSAEVNGHSKPAGPSVDHTAGHADEIKDHSNTLLEVFAQLDGLALIACHLPSLTLDDGPPPTDDVAKGRDRSKTGDLSASPFSYYDSITDWTGFDDEDCLYGPMDKSWIPPGIELPPLYDKHYPDQASMEFLHSGGASPDKMPSITQRASTRPLQPGSKLCVPPFTLSALRAFLMLPMYAECLLRDSNAARCLLRIALGVDTDGGGKSILNLRLASSLPMLPFATLRRLLANNDCSTRSGIRIRESMTFQSNATHILVACISRFSHVEPCKESTTGKMLRSMIFAQFPPSPTQKKSSSSDEKNYWARGTGFGTGSTSSDWDAGDMVKKQMKDEGYLTEFIKVLSNFVCPESAISCDGAEDDFDSIAAKCISWNEKLTNSIIDLVNASGLISAMASYLRNDSVLDMSSHVSLYCALLGVIRSFSLCPALRQLLLKPAIHVGSSDDPDSSSILTLLAKMKKCIDTYSSRLETLNTSIDVHGEEGFSTFVQDVKRTEAMLRKILEGSVKHQEDVTHFNTEPSLLPPTQSTEEIYTETMKELQFDTAMLVEENEPGKYRFPSNHHFGKQIKECANVSDPSRARRLAQEAVTLSNSLPLSLSSTVFVRCDEERLDVMKVLITGPIDTPYANGCFEFDVFFPSDYNKSPPLINLHTTGNHSVRFNPNLYNDGKVCLSVLNTWHGRPEERWNPQTSSFLQILVSIQSLILVKEPYFNEPGYERSRGTPAGEQCSKEYDANIQQATVKWGMLEQLRKPSPCFKEVIQSHFWIKKAEILKQCDAWLSDMKKHILLYKGRKTIPHSCVALQKHISLLQGELEKLEKPQAGNKEN